MKIIVVADKSGMILGALIPEVTTNRARAVNSMQLRPMEGQTVHEADLPVELFEHLGKSTLTPELMKYRVEKKGKKAALLRE
jgi:hypothetical protein